MLTPRQSSVRIGGVRGGVQRRAPGGDAFRAESSQVVVDVGQLAGRLGLVVGIQLHQDLQHLAVAAEGLLLGLGEQGVSVQAPWPAGSSDGAPVPWSAASPAATRKANSGRRCRRQVAATVSSRSAKRLPASRSDPKLPLRLSTAGRKARSDTLFVGSTPSTRANLQRRPPLRQVSTERRGLAVRVLLPTQQPLPQPRCWLTDARWQDGILRAQGGSLQPGRRHLLQQRRGVRSQHLRLRLWRQGEPRVDHAAVVARRGPLGKLSARPSHRGR